MSAREFVRLNVATEDATSACPLSVQQRCLDSRVCTLTTLKDTQSPVSIANTMPTTTTTHRMLVTRHGAVQRRTQFKHLIVSRTATSLLPLALALGCNGSECDGESCEDAEPENPTEPPRETHEADAATGELASEDAGVDAGGEDTEQPFLYCDGGVSAVPISEVAEVTASCETAGIGGWWYCFQDDINPSGCIEGELPFDPDRSGLCLSGSTTVDPSYVAFGAGVGLTLNQGPNGRRPWNAAARNIVGFRVVLTGETNGLGLRVIFTTSANDRDEDPMIDLPGPGEYEILFENVRYPLASPLAGDPVDPAALYDAQVMVVGAESEGSYDFCLTEFTPVYGE